VSYRALALVVRVRVRARIAASGALRSRDPEIGDADVTARFHGIDTDTDTGVARRAPIARGGAGVEVAAVVVWGPSFEQPLDKESAAAVAHAHRQWTIMNDLLGVSRKWTIVWRRTPNRRAQPT
jgi:hypothetical protein